ncbi:hypothetical protein GWI33_023070 [Rhynchophorus ferrugineus]|uniref:Uncharacterized protein n=1 Tax=Rhynchophorus ferrugineus TaxID=354439 RepID=A0A834HND8_RHYFE|nr:hypothetical protein GWI33_023071 [Rhynchophorus ferrugineus]KAF7264544.1 hypothetical protein GWI33_023070 [Rhynchophorus ferrugineus]
MKSEESYTRPLPTPLPTDQPPRINLSCLLQQQLNTLKDELEQVKRGQNKALQLNYGQTTGLQDLRGTSWTASYQKDFGY